MKKLLTLTAIVAVAGCAEGTDVTMPVVETQPSFASVTGEMNRARPRPQSWVDGELFAGVVTPATFNPESDPFDELYKCGDFGGFFGWSTPDLGVEARRSGLQRWAVAFEPPNRRNSLWCRVFGCE